MPQRTPSYTVSADFAQNLLWSAQAEGLRVKHWTDALAGPYAHAARVPLSLLVDVWASLLAQDDDPLLGLRLGKHFRLGRWGMAEFFLLNARTLGDALHNAVRYWRLVVDGEKQVTLTQTGPRWRLSIDPVAQYATRAHEVDMTYAVNMMRMLIGQAPQGLAIGFASPFPGEQHRAAYVAHFGCPVAFDQNGHWLEIPDALMEQALPIAHPLVLDAARVQADLQLRMLDRPSELSATVAQLVELGAANLERAARQLGVSARSLQRRLQSEGASFASLKDQAQQRRARRLLQEPRISLKEVAYFLGYEERGLSQACVRWFGASPGQLRVKWLAGGTPADPSLR